MSTPAEEVAAELVAARREGRSLTRFPGVFPASMEEAYQIQELAMSRWQDNLVGWKIGYIPADRRTAGDPDRLVGPIWSQQCHHSEEHRPPAELGIFASGFAAVEAELVIRLGQDPPDHDRDPWTAEEAADLEQNLLVGIEVASSPIPDINALGPTVIASDFGNNNGLVLGSILTDQPGKTRGPTCLLRRRAAHGRRIRREPARRNSSRPGDCPEYPRRPWSAGPGGNGLRHGRHHRYPSDPAGTALSRRRAGWTISRTPDRRCPLVGAGLGSEHSWTTVDATISGIAAAVSCCSFLAGRGAASVER